jgi:hypothetical protein
MAAFTGSVLPQAVRIKARTKITVRIILFIWPNSCFEFDWHYQSGKMVSKGCSGVVKMRLKVG